jgi:hypothetical protein
MRIVFLVFVMLLQACASAPKVPTVRTERTEINAYAYEPEIVTYSVERTVENPLLACRYRPDSAAARTRAESWASMRLTVGECAIVTCNGQATIRVCGTGSF